MGKLSLREIEDYQSFQDEGSKDSEKVYYKKNQVKKFGKKQVKESKQYT